MHSRPSCSDMEWPDIPAELLSMGLGVSALLVLSYYLRRVSDPTSKQWIATAAGIIFTVYKERWRAVYLVVLVAVNTLLIRYGSKRRCRLLSFILSFACLFLYYIEGYYALLGQHMKVHIFMMLFVIRLVHLAGEVQDSFKAANSHNDDVDPRSKICLEVSPIEIFHFSFCYVGSMTFYRYVTYHDWIHRPLHPHADCHGEVVKRVKFFLLATPCYFLMNSLLPIKAIISDDFYERTFLYKFTYAMYASIVWNMIAFAAFVLLDMFAIAAGMGAYPVSTNPRPGQGPTVNLELLDQLADSPEKAKLEKYNFHAIRGIFLYKAWFAPTLRKFWKNYNCFSQYFLVTNVYKQVTLKKYRLLVTFATTALWHSDVVFWYPTLIFIVATIGTEDIWYSLCRKDATGRRAQIIDSLFWLARHVSQPIMLLALLYLTDWQPIIKLLASIYFLPYLFVAFFLALGMCLRYLRQGSQQLESIKESKLL